MSKLAVKRFYCRNCGAGHMRQWSKTTKRCERCGNQSYTSNVMVIEEKDYRRNKDKYLGVAKKEG